MPLPALPGNQDYATIPVIYWVGFMPIFYLCRQFVRAACTLARTLWTRMGPLTDVVEPILVGLGFELVDAQASNHGRLLRIFIDRPDGITVEHCADVSRHLSRVFAVEGVEYDRLEVSSPGLDRPLKKSADFIRFCGSKADVRMRAPRADGRKRFVGVLQSVEGAVVNMEVDGAPVALEIAGMERARLVPDLWKKAGV